MITIIGDVHGKHDEYYKLTSQFENTLQIGDLNIGFKTLKPQNINHKFIHGNHDNPNLCQTIPNFLGRYGVYKSLFFVSGAESYDKHHRYENNDWWANEELSYSEWNSCISLYKNNPKNVIISHDAPQDVIGFIRGDIHDKTTTRMGLSTMFNIHKPKLWIFGHYHKSLSFMYKGCNFICLDILETLDIHI